MNDTNIDLINIFENDFDMYLNIFCEENNIQDLRKESQAVWNSCLRYIYKHVFKDKNLLKSKVLHKTNSTVQYSTYNAYNYDLVLDVLDIYIYDLCMKYDKEVSIIGFSTLTGIDDKVILDWGNGTRLSKTSCEIYEKLRNFREESLSNKLATGNKNPVGILAILNRHYQWNMPGVSRESVKTAALPASELPKLAGSASKNGDAIQLESGSVTNTVYTVEND